MWSSIANKWWSVQVRLQICDAVEVHYYDAKYSHIELHLPLRVPEWSSGDFTFGFLSITENGFFTQRKKETAKKTIIGDAAWEVRMFLDDRTGEKKSSIIFKQWIVEVE